MKPIRVLLADDHKLVRAGFRAMLNSLENMEVVAETGDGRDIDSIFKPLWQVDDCQQGGLGLGLAIVQEVVVLHGGSIQVHSGGLGNGTTFVLKMPWAAKSVVSSG